MVTIYLKAIFNILAFSKTLYGTIRLITCNMCVSIQIQTSWQQWTAAVSVPTVVRTSLSSPVCQLLTKICWQATVSWLWLDSALPGWNCCSQWAAAAAAALTGESTAPQTGTAKQPPEATPTSSVHRKKHDASCRASIYLGFHFTIRLVNRLPSTATLQWQMWVLIFRPTF